MTTSPSGSCRACGAPAVVQEQLARTREEQQKEATATKGYQTVLLGVAMMIGGILGSMCCTGLAGNGQIVLVSEMYQAKASAVNGIESVRKSAPLSDRYDKLISKTGKHYFTLKL